MAVLLAPAERYKYLWLHVNNKNLTHAKSCSNYSLVIVLLLSVILLGLASRHYPWLFPQAWGKYPGDALWSVAVYLAMAFIWPKISCIKLLFFSLSVSYCVELSQLYQAQWINHIRENAIGHLFLGSTFGCRDLIAYTVGVIIIFVLDTYFTRVKKTI